MGDGVGTPQPLFFLPPPSSMKEVVSYFRLLDVHAYDDSAVRCIPSVVLFSQSVVNALVVDWKKNTLQLSCVFSLRSTTVKFSSHRCLSTNCHLVLRVSYWLIAWPSPCHAAMDRSSSSCPISEQGPQWKHCRWVMSTEGNDVSCCMSFSQMEKLQSFSWPYLLSVSYSVQAGEVFGFESVFVFIYLGDPDERPPCSKTTFFLRPFLSLLSVNQLLTKDLPSFVKNLSCE